MKRKRILSQWIGGVLLFVVSWNYLPAQTVELAEKHVTVNEKSRIYMTFDSQDGNVFSNLKDKKNSGKSTGSISLLKGLFSKALRTGKDSFVEVTEGHTQLYAMTVEFWIQRGLTSGKTVLLETTDKEGRTGWRLELLPEKDNSILSWTTSHPDGTLTTISSSRGLAKADQWYRVALTWGSIYGGQKALRIYLDGCLVSEKPNYKLMRSVKGPLKIKTPPEGLIDDLALSVGSVEIYRDIKDVNIPVKNLDFEQQAEGWTGVYDDPVIDAKEKHSGKYSLRIETDDSYTREYLSPIFSVEPDAVYRISFWAKLDKFEKGYSAIGMWIRWYFAPEETCSIGGDFVANYTAENKKRKFGWRKFTADVPVPRKSFYHKKIKWARLQIKNYHSEVLVWVDDIEVENVSRKP